MTYSCPLLVKLKESSDVKHLTLMPELTKGTIYKISRVFLTGLPYLVLEGFKGLEDATDSLIAQD